MVQSLTVKCPHCQQVAEIYLSTNACVIILNCPSCNSPIMYFDHKIFILSQNQVEAIKDKARSSAMMNMLKNMAQPYPQNPPAESLPGWKDTAAPHAAGVVSSGMPRNVPVKKKIHIGTDDITNLRIDLALCNDVQEFIDRM